MPTFRRHNAALFKGIFAALVVITTIAAQQSGRNDTKPAPVDAKVLKSAGMPGDPNAGTWLTYGLNQGETRFSPLKDIDTLNVGRLALSWTYTLGAGGGNQEDTPLVWNNTIYGITNWSVVFALDARTGKELWRWDPEVNQQAVRPKLCCGVVNRGLAIYNGMIYAPINDGRLEALDAFTGKPIWEARVAYPQDWYTMTIAPRIANGKVIIGVSGGDHPTRGYFDAYDAATGNRAWRFYTVPGDPSKPYENEAMRAAGKTWGGDYYKLGGGGAVWDGIAYDPDTDLVYVGTGNAEPWVQKFRGAKDMDNLYTCSILAVQVSTGQLKWHFQTVPNDNWDFDNVQQIILADLTINGRQRKVLMQAPKNGFFYVLDRVTGQFISAQPFTQLNWSKGLDERGRPMVNPGAYYGGDPVTILAAAGGAHNWSPMSFNPTTGLVYIPTIYAGFTFAAADEMPPGGQTGHTGLKPGRAAATPNDLPLIGPQPLEGNGTRGVLEAWDPVNQKLVWRTPGGGGIGGGTVTTAGNLVFQTINDGRLMAYSADKGEKLLELQTGRRGLGPPITYMIDGKQYVALMGGAGRTAGTTGPTNDKVDFPPMFYVFEVGGTAPMPAAQPAPAGGAPPPPTEPHNN